MTRTVRSQHSATRFAEAITVGFLLLEACGAPLSPPSVRTVYERVGLPVSLDFVPPREYTTLAERLILDGRPESGTSRRWAVVRSSGVDPATARPTPVRLDTLVRDGLYTRRGDSLTVTVTAADTTNSDATGPKRGYFSACPSESYETFVVMAAGATLRTVATGPLCGIAILRIQTYRRTTP